MRADITPTGEQTPAAGGRSQRIRPRPARLAVTAVAAVLVLVAALLAVGQASARSASAGAALSPSVQRGPDPTIAMIEATRGPFATAQVAMPSGHGFGGGMIYYPTDTSQGTWGALAIVPGYSALFADEEAWMGPWLSSFGFVVVGVETNTRTDSDSQRAAELLAALDYLTTQSATRSIRPGWRSWDTPPAVPGPSRRPSSARL